MALIGTTSYNLRFGQTLNGSDASDTIYGYDGNDWLYGGGGGDVIYGGSGDDHIYPSLSWAQNANAYWGPVYAEGGSGNDWIDFSMNLSNGNTIYGDGRDIAYTSDGVDTIFGSQGKDCIYGGGNSDTIYGGDGADVIYGGWLGQEYTNDGDNWLYGQGGNDDVNGGYGNDHISGGSGVDSLTGGWGNNTFIFGPNDSPGWGYYGTNYYLADKITDFYSPWDSIDVYGSPGTPSNYAEFAFANNGMGDSAAFDYAANFAQYYFMYQNKQYVFATDGHNGYLFGDLNGDHSVDTRVVLQDVTSLNGFDYWDIV